MGRGSVNNIIINTISPFMYAWGKYTGKEEYINKSYELLSSIPAEENNLISRWKDAGIKVKNAVDSQGLLQLKIIHCSEKKCLTCNVGNTIISLH